jgi:SDR family mycofactocin-dependent oxidoreductase
MSIEEDVKMGKLDGKVALITGAARGQGRSHAVAFAREGAKLVVTDICADLPSVRYEMPTESDLEETVALVRAAGGEIVSSVADVRDGDAMEALVARGLDAFGRIDIVCANAGISTYGRLWELSRAEFDEMISVCLTGVWETCRAALPQMIQRGDGGALIATSSCAGLRGFQNAGHYSAAKHGVVGLMKSLAIELGGHSIRANAVCPFTVATKMIMNEVNYSLMTGGQDPTEDAARKVFQRMNLLPTPWIQPEDVTALFLLLASDEGRFITGQAIAIDAGFLQH